MSSVRYSYRSILSQEFDLFYYELLRVKEQALRSYLPAEKIDASNKDKTITVHGPALKLHEELTTFLERQYERMQRMAVGPSTMYVQDAFYVFIALADEVLINLAWQGSDYWRQNCLEIKFFQSQIAGEKIFQQLDGILKIADPLQKDLARLYLLALSLGFKGKYRGLDLTPIQNYKQQVFSFLYNTTLSKDNLLGKELFDGNLAHIFTEAPSEGLPDLRQWGWTAFSVFILYLFISYGVWAIISSDLHQVLKDIFTLARQGSIV